MRRLSELLKRFRKDESGAFMVLFGVLAVVLVATAGAVVDFTGVQQARTRSQTALDAAALSLQALIGTDSEDVLKQKADKILDEGLDDLSIESTVNSAVKNTTEGSLKLTATIVVPTYFVGLIGIPTIDAKLVSEATRKQLDLEVAMVLDNSISMNSSSRMTNLKLAANCAVGVLLNGNCNSTATTASIANVKIGIVPFTEFVNVGNTNKTAAWMTQTGNTPRSIDNFDGDDNETTAYSTAVDRFALYTQMGVTWSGCVEARNHTTGTGGLYYDTSDLPADTTVPDSMFVPVFAPDQPDSGGYPNHYMADRPSVCTNKDQGSWVQVKSKTNCTSNGNNNAGNYNSCATVPTTTTTQKDQNNNTVSPAAATEPASINGQAKVCTDTYTSKKTQNSPARWTNTYTRTCSYTFSDRELQERLCKYNTTTNTISSNSNFQAGPNADCGVELLPLTTTKSSISSKITAMGPDGGTNIHQGIMWGFHMLSKQAPLAEAKDYDTVTSKVMIIMTDGENTTSSAGMNAATAGNTITSWNGGDWYLAYGYPYSRRLDTSGVQGTTWTALQTEMNSRAEQTCTNAKAEGIVVYTIGLATSTTSNPSAVTTMLTNCATDAAHAYFPAAASDLTSVFSEIASQLADLRLAL
ncbi:MAG: TadE/TadG family type IV pilus assembly protein [Devosia sp.]